MEEYLPPRCVTLQILAFPLEHAGSDFRGSWMMLSRVFDLFQPAQRQIRINEVRITAHKTAPFLVSGHGNRSTAELLDCGVHLVRITLEDACKSIVGFLDLTDND